MRSQSNSCNTSFPLLLKYGASLLCLFLMVVVVACGGESSHYVSVTPEATFTVVFGQDTTSPTPTLLPYYCGGWATETTPGYSAKGVVMIYGKFTYTVLGNPEGVANASAVATVIWPDGSTETEQETTSGDGLAVFTIPLRPSALNHLVQVQMIFTSPTGYTCRIPQAAYFTAITATSTPSASPTPGCHRRRCNTPTVTPTATKKTGTSQVLA